MKKSLGIATLATGLSALALAPAGAGAQTAPSADCSTLGLPGKVLTIDAAPVASLTVRPCVPTGVSSCPDDASYELLKLPQNPLVRLQLVSCKAPPA